MRQRPGATPPQVATRNCRKLNVSPLQNCIKNNDIAPTNSTQSVEKHIPYKLHRNNLCMKGSGYRHKKHRRNGRSKFVIKEKSHKSLVSYGFFKSYMTPWGFEPQFTDRKSVVLDQARRWGHLCTIVNEGRWTRTIDTRLKRAVLYRLSYAPIIQKCMKIARKK